MSGLTLGGVCGKMMCASGESLFLLFAHPAHSSSGLGHRPLKAKITGSNPVCATKRPPAATSGASFCAFFWAEHNLSAYPRDCAALVDSNRPSKILWSEAAQTTLLGASVTE